MQMSIKLEFPTSLRGVLVLLLCTRVPCSSPLFQRSVALGDIEVTSVWRGTCGTGLFHTEHNIATHNFVTHDSFTDNIATHTHTHTHLETHTHTHPRAHAPLSHTTPSHTNCHAQLCHTHTHTARSHNLFSTMSHHVTMSFRCPAFPISCSHRFGRCWKKLTCWTIRFLNVLAMVPRKTVADVSKIQNYRRGEWF